MSDKELLRAYPIPQGVIKQKDYIVRVRSKNGEWKVIECYQVKVDMHDVREASMAFFDFEGSVEVEITFPGFYSVYSVDIRPLSLEIKPHFSEKVIRFTMDRPMNISIEINKDRHHNLHLFSNGVMDINDIDMANAFIVRGSNGRGENISDGVNYGKLIYVEPGIHYVDECIWHIKSDTKVILAGGAIIVGSIVCEGVENVSIEGRGVILQREFNRFTGMNGIRISNSTNISVENVIIINPPHYTVFLGQSQNIKLINLKSFSCEGWSDGIDMMSCTNVKIEGGFLRTSDDCVAIYGSRWQYKGDTRDILVKDITLWADVAHPLMIGVHGDYTNDGDRIEHIRYENIDILEHNEYQQNYLGVMAINVGDKNIVKDVHYSNIRIEAFKHGKILDFQVKQNKDYNPAPGKGIYDVYMSDIFIESGYTEEISQIAGYSEEYNVNNIKISNMWRNGIRVNSLEEANIEVGKYAHNVAIM